jgi:hypothetical protein
MPVSGNILYKVLIYSRGEDKQPKFSQRKKTLPFWNLSPGLCSHGEGGKRQK